MNEKNAISVVNVTQRYGRSVILRNIDIEVPRGEIIGFLGPSGAGKTTLVKVMVGMIKPSEGKVTVIGTDMPSLKASMNIGYMAQSDALYEDLSALDNLLFFASLYGMKNRESRERAKEVLSLVKLESDGKKLVRNYSGGMKRRLSLAIAMIHRPDILILDEPTVGIDPVLRREFWNEFRRLRDNGTTIVVTTHVMDEAEHCDHLALIRDGAIIAFGSPSHIKVSSNQETIEEAFLYYSSGGRECI